MTTGFTPGSFTSTGTYTDDPLDANDVAADHPEIVQWLGEQIERFRQFASAAGLDDTAATEGLDA